MEEVMQNEYNSSSNRVYTLYRVSTLGQVEKDDIPMQKQRCREFAAAHGWEIVKEFSEKGVSGFKVSAKNRDAIQEIQRDAIAGKFDILLVFMFDRLGRRDDETPFVVEWFVKNGIEVWSAMEGQQRFDTHVDKLLNYIRYWQASGESIKTSMRVKTRLSQLTEAGLYTGGSVPYGYRIEKTGRVNKKNHEVYDLVVDDDEAEIVRLIFHKYVDEGYGALRICNFLHEKGITSRGGKGFPNTTLNRIIKNEIYIGVLKNGEVQTHLEDLRIIDDSLFQRAQVIRTERTQPHSPIPLNSKGKSLLVGNVYCAHCGWRLTLTTSGRRKKLPDGTIVKEVIPRYQCHYNVRHPGECDGQSGYSVKKLDGLVEKVIRLKFAELKAASESEVLTQRHKKELRSAEKQLESTRETLQECQSEYDDLKAETIKVIRGQSSLSSEFLNELVTEAEKKIAAAQETVAAAEQRYSVLQESIEGIKAEYDQLLTWADIYDQCSMEAKKMIVAQLIKSVHVGRDYNLEIEFNFSFDEFQNTIIANEKQIRVAN